MRYGYQFVADYYAETRKKWVSRMYRPAGESHENAEDIVQEAFIKALKAIKDYDPDLSDFPTGFQLKIDSEYKDYMAKERRQGLGDNLKDEYVDEEHAELVSLDDSDYDLVNKLRGDLRELSEKASVVVYLYYWRGYNRREIMGACGVTKGEIDGILDRHKTDARRKYLHIYLEE